MLFVDLAVSARCALQGKFSCKELDDALGSQRSATQGKRNAVPDKWIDKSGGVARHQNAVPLGLRITED